MAFSPDLEEPLMQDWRYAARVLLRTPGFATAAIATLALGIGAATAIYSVAYGVSLRPLPYPEAEQLVRIYEANPANGRLKHEVSFAAFHAWREGAPSIVSAALFTTPRTRFEAGPEGRPVTVTRVSPGFFDVLGVGPMLGPGFKDEREYTRFTAHTEAVLSYGAWQRLFGGRPDVIGQSLVFAGISGNDASRVVGVMPPGFTFDVEADVWLPSLIVELPINRLYREWRYERVVARLRPGSTIDRARGELESIAGRLAADFPATNRGWTVTIESLHDAIVGSFGRATWLLLAAVIVVLLVACLNVGGLLVARSVERQRETAVRLALGAGSSRLFRLWFAEAAILGGGGMCLGIPLAWSGVALLKAAAPPGIPRLDAVALDLPILAMAVASTLVAVMVASFAPNRRSAERDLTGGLRAGSLGGGDLPARHATRAALTACQCAGAAVLIVMAIMLARSFIKLTRVDPGWDAAGVLSLNVDPPVPPELRRPWARFVEWSDRLIARLEATPGIVSAAITTQVPLSSRTYPATLARGRARAKTDTERWVGVNHVVSDGYFETMRIRLVRGRTFEAHDRFTPEQLVDSSTWTQGVVIVSESTARTLWPGSPALGQALWLPDTEPGKWREVIGVVEDIQFHAIPETPGLHVFTPWSQRPTGGPRLVVRGAGDTAAIVASVRQVVAAVEPGTRVDQVLPLETLVSRATAQPRFTSRLASLFGGLALVLTSIGIYGTLSYVVRTRRREIGIRMALGASPAQILRRTLRQGLLPVIGGAAMGLAASIALARAFSALLFDVAPVDPGSIAGGAALVLIAALAAALGPASRASRVDPAVTLRSE